MKKLLLIVLLSGCASGPVPPDDATGSWSFSLNRVETDCAGRMDLTSPTSGAFSGTWSCEDQNGARFSGDVTGMHDDNAVFLSLGQSGIDSFSGTWASTSFSARSAGSGYPIVATKH